MTAHVWDGGVARASHQEYDGDGGTNRFSVGDGSSTLNFHAAHVTGTIMASGVQSAAKGMAPHAKAVGHDWNSDQSEAAAAAATGMLVSNHSYGYATRDASGNVQLPDYFFGGYIDVSKEWDEILFNAPYYLMVVAAGNDGNDNSANSNPTGGFGFDKLSGHATAKNNLVVANAQDASVDANGNLISVSINGSSSEGPTDDFRIKPDITGNGTEVYSTYESSNSAYASITGTSMASPNVTGSLLILQQHYQNVTGSFMRSATLKGLALHTADDAGSVGPDAVFGWGLLNAKSAATTITNEGDFSKIEELTLSQGDSYTITVDSDGTNPLLASISWTDRAGAEVTSVNSTTPVLVNDLDVRVFKNNDEYFPYELTGATSSTARDNDVDPYERVDVNDASGSYTIVVTHKGSLTGGSQNFSLIVTGVSTDDVETPDTADTSAPTTPSNITVSNITENSATISWSASTDNVAVTGYKVYNSSTLLGEITDTDANLTGLISDTLYNYSITAIDAEGNESSAGFVTFTTDGDSDTGGENLTYCNSEGSDSSFEWIDYVEFVGVVNSTGDDGGYADYTSLSAVVAPGSTNTLLISAGFATSAYTEYWKIWIDYDQNGTFDDNEIIASGSSSSSDNLSVSVTIPTTATLGTTVMRVSMKYDAEQTACETFEYGEVEDYTVNITNNATASKTIPTSDFVAEDVATTVLGFEQAFEFKAYPNPSTDFVKINLQNVRELNFEIRNIIGQLEAKDITDTGIIDVTNMSPGVYFLNVSDGQKTFNTKLIISE